MISPLSPTRLTHVLNVPRSRLWCQELNSPRADLQAVFSPRVLLSLCCIPPATNAREPNVLPRYDLLTSEWVTARSLKRRGNHVSNSVAWCKRVGFKLSSLLCFIAYCWPYRKALPDVSNGTANLRGRWASSVGRTREKWSHTSAFHRQEHTSLRPTTLGKNISTSFFHSIPISKRTYVLWSRETFAGALWESAVVLQPWFHK